MLRDHFHPPLKGQRFWESFHGTWIIKIMESLNAFLPEDYYAEANVRFGIEIDVASYKGADGRPGGSAHEAAVLTAWTVPSPAMTVPLPMLQDEIELLIYRQFGGPQLRGAIELVSPANKDRPRHRDAFASKCATLLHKGIGVMIVDIVTEYRATLHKTLLSRLGVAAMVGSESHLYSASYHPVERDGQPNLDIWHEPMTVGSPLVTMPLFLKDGPHVPVDLATTYQNSLVALRIH
jgi:hypothetical protein